MEGARARDACVHPRHERALFSLFTRERVDPEDHEARSRKRACGRDGGGLLQPARFEQP
jgi:hypothetical protein